MRHNRKKLSKGATETKGFSMLGWIYNLSLMYTDKLFL